MHGFITLLDATSYDKYSYSMYMYVLKKDHFAQDMNNHTRFVESVHEQQWLHAMHATLIPKNEKI